MALDPSLDTMVPLYSFVTTMAEKLLIDGVVEQFMTIKTVLRASSLSPAVVKASVKLVRDSAASTEASVLASFEGLPQGKRILEIADEYVIEREKTHAHLSKIEDAQKGVQSLVLNIKDNYARGEIGQVSELIETLDSIQKKTLDEESAKRVESTRKLLLNVVIDDKIIDAHLVAEFQPWLVSAQASLTGASTLPGFPVSHIQKLPSTLTAKLGELSNFAGKISEMFELTQSFKQGSVKAAHVCVHLGKMAVGLQEVL